MHHPTDRIIHTTAFVKPVVEHWLEREIAQWVHLMKDRSDDPSHHERTLLPRSYISLPSSVMSPIHGSFRKLHFLGGFLAAVVWCFCWRFLLLFVGFFGKFLAGLISSFLTIIYAAETVTHVVNHT